MKTLRNKLLLLSLSVALPLSGVAPSGVLADEQPLPETENAIVDSGNTSDPSLAAQVTEDGNDDSAATEAPSDNGNTSEVNAPASNSESGTPVADGELILSAAQGEGEPDPNQNQGNETPTNSNTPDNGTKNGSGGEGNNDGNEQGGEGNNDGNEQGGEGEGDGNGQEGEEEMPVELKEDGTVTVAASTSSVTSADEVSYSVSYAKSSDQKATSMSLSMALPENFQATSLNVGSWDGIGENKLTVSFGSTSKEASSGESIALEGNPSSITISVGGLTNIANISGVSVAGTFDIAKADGTAPAFSASVAGRASDETEVKNLASGSASVEITAPIVSDGTASISASADVIPADGKVNYTMSYTPAGGNTKMYGEEVAITLPDGFVPSSLNVGSWGDMSGNVAVQFGQFSTNTAAGTEVTLNPEEANTIILSGVGLESPVAISGITLTGAFADVGESGASKTAIVTVSGKKKEGDGAFVALASSEVSISDFNFIVSAPAFANTSYTATHNETFKVEFNGIEVESSSKIDSFEATIDIPSGLFMKEITLPKFEGANCQLVLDEENVVQSQYSVRRNVARVTIKVNPKSANFKQTGPLVAEFLVEKNENTTGSFDAFATAKIGNITRDGVASARVEFKKVEEQTKPSTPTPSNPSTPINPTPINPTPINPSRPSPSNPTPALTPTTPTLISDLTKSKDDETKAKDTNTTKKTETKTKDTTTKTQTTKSAPQTVVKAPDVQQPVVQAPAAIVQPIRTTPTVAVTPINVAARYNGANRSQITTIGNTLTDELRNADPVQTERVYDYSSNGRRAATALTPAPEEEKDKDKRTRTPSVATINGTVVKEEETEETSSESTVENEDATSAPAEEISKTEAEKKKESAKNAVEEVKQKRGVMLPAIIIGVLAAGGAVLAGLFFYWKKKDAASGDNAEDGEEDAPTESEEK